jgi:hypothetical protein
VVTNKERGFTGHPRLQELLDAWFSPKGFESEAFYERVGVLFIKRYVPTGGDFFIRRYGIRIVRVCLRSHQTDEGTAKECITLHSGTS